MELQKYLEELYFLRFSLEFHLYICFVIQFQSVIGESGLQQYFKPQRGLTDLSALKIVLGYFSIPSSFLKYCNVQYLNLGFSGIEGFFI